MNCRIVSLIALNASQTLEFPGVSSSPGAPQSWHEKSLSTISALGPTNQTIKLAVCKEMGLY